MKNEEIKFTGTITEFDDSCFHGGSCRFKIGEAWVTVQEGKSSGNVLKGKLVGIELNTETASKVVGKQAEVFAQKIDDSELSIYGSEEYFIKLTD